MNQITLTEIRHRDRVYHLREPITLHVANDIAGLCVTLYGDEPGSEIRGYAPGHPDREPSDADLADAVRDFADGFDCVFNTVFRADVTRDTNEYVSRMMSMIENAKSRIVDVEDPSRWPASVIAANRERGGVAAIHGQAPAEEDDATFVEQVTEPDARDRRERAMMRLLVESCSTSPGRIITDHSETGWSIEQAIEAAIQEEMERE